MSLMKERHRVWLDAVNGADIEAYARMMTEDLIWLPPDGEPIIGRAAFRNWLRPFFEAYAYEFALEDVQACETDGWIAETGAFITRMTPRAGGTGATHGGRYFALWRPGTGGEWQIERYVDQAALRRE